jgi:hypothetical protein
MRLVRRGLEILREDGVDEFVDRASTFYRQKVPGPLSPLYPYLVTYDNDAIAQLADTVYRTQHPQSVEIGYSGDLGAQTPQFLKNEDWLTTNRGRKLYEFSDADVIGTKAGVFQKNKYRPQQDGPPSTVRAGDQFVVPATVDTDGRRKAEALQHIDQNLGTTGVIRHWPSGTTPDREFDLAFLLPTPYGQAYAAFQSDLFKLRALERYTEHFGEEPQLIVPPGPSELVETYLSLMGYPPESYVTLGDETIRANRLLVPTHRPRKGDGEIQPSPSDRPWARDRILSNLDVPDSEYYDRLYVSRQDERRRRVVNFDEIRPILETYDFRVYNPGNHSLKDQIRTFSQANLFVGPHSSGMLNSMFAHDATMIEVLSTEHWRTSTPFIGAHDMGFDYEICPADPISDSHSTKRHQDIVVDPDQFEAVIEKAVESRKSTPQAA